MQYQRALPHACLLKISLIYTSWITFWFEVGWHLRSPALRPFNVWIRASECTNNRKASNILGPRSGHYMPPRVLL